MAFIFILKKGRSQRVTESSSASTLPTPTSIEGLRSSDLVLSTSGACLNILVSGQVAVNLVLAKVGNWILDNNVLTIYSEDELALVLTFLDSTHAANGMTILTDGINNL